VIRSWDGRQPLKLPDDEPPEPNKVSFASGAWDGIATHHMAATEEHREASLVTRTLKAFGQLVRKDSDRNRAALYSLLMKESVIPFADALVEELARQTDFGPAEARPHARWLLGNACHREPLKLGIILTGLCGDADDLDDLKAVARHDEFTLYAVVAAGNLLDDPTNVWWEMAQHVDGWGKIHAVERLCRQAEDRADVRAWLLRHGCANAVMPEYLAGCCARAGKLFDALGERDVDDELLDGAVTILDALLRGGPAEDIECYEDGVAAVERLVELLILRCNSLTRLAFVKSLLHWLEWRPEPSSESDPHGPDKVLERRREAGWTDPGCADLAAQCREILTRPHWAEQVRTAFETGNDQARYHAWFLAPAVGVDLWEAAFRQLGDRPLDSTLWWNLGRTNDPDRSQRLMAFAERSLPLAEIASGPADHLGFGLGFQAHCCLGFLVQEMSRPGIFSRRLVATALRSPVTNNRSMAANALEKQPVELWGDEVSAALRQTCGEEPNEDLRRRLQALVERVDSEPSK
jgi:hypothetical protein